MSAERITQFSLGQILALFGFGAAALLVTGVQPVLLGGLIEAGIVDLVGAGHLASTETIALGAGVGIATAFFPLRTLRISGIVATVLLASANLVSAFAAGFEQLLICRIVSGFAAGILIWIVTSLIVRTRSPERLAGYYMAGYTLIQSIAVAILAAFLVPAFGWRGCFYLLAGATLLPAILAGAVPTDLKALPRREAARGRVSPAILFAGAVIFFQIIMTLTIWVFLEPIGQLTGASPQSVQFVISVSLLIQIIGAAIAGFAAPKYSAAISLLVVTMIMIAIAVYVTNINAVPGALFLPIALIFSFFWMYMLPFQTKLAMDVDPSGRLALAVPPVQIAGSAIAPTAAGMAAGAGPASGVAIVSIWCGLGAFVALAAGLVLRRRALRSIDDGHANGSYHGE